MMKSMQFYCKVDDQVSLLQLTKEILTITNEYLNLSLKVSLDQKIKWIVQKEELIGFQVEDLIIIADPGNLTRMKQQLGGQIAYSGIKYFYSFQKTLSKNKNGQTKVCILKRNENDEQFACKCFKKNVRPSNLIYEEIYLLISLQNQSFAPKIFEVYESTHCIYLVMEYLEYSLEYEITEDKMKSVIFNLFSIVQSLENLKIAHKTLTRPHILLDDDSNIKLVGFGSAKRSEVSCYEFELDIFKITSILYKYYQKQNKQSVPLIENLLNQQYLYLFNITLALQDPYFQTVRQEGILQEIKSMHPKFKGNIENDLENHTNSFSQQQLSIQKKMKVLEIFSLKLYDD